jgi:hypothetical protein
MDGCSSCPVAGLGLRMALPNNTAKSGGKVYACRPSTGVPVVSVHCLAQAPDMSALVETMACKQWQRAFAWPTMVGSLPAGHAPSPACPAIALPLVTCHAAGIQGAC